MKYEEGFYWAKRTDLAKWEVVRFENDIWWKFGFEDYWQVTDFYKIGPKIEAPE